MSKIGLQFQSGVINDYDKLLAKRPATVMLLGLSLNLDLARFTRAHSSGTQICLRWAGDGDWSLDAGWAERFVANAIRMFAPFRDAGVCDAVLSGNEPVIRNDVEARALATAQIYIADRFHAAGFPTVIGFNFSVGNPDDFRLWQYLQDACASVQYIGLHEYAAPRMTDGGGFWTLRYRKVWPLLSARARKPILITECGIDGGVIGKSGGYKAFTTMGDYLTQLSWYDGELAKDAYIAGAHIFLGANADPRWQKFDVLDGDEERAEFIGWLKAGTVTPPPNPPPAPDAEGTMWAPFAERHPTTKLFATSMPMRAVVLHIAEGTYESAVSWLSDAAANPDSSAHFVIAKNGRIAQLVPIDRGAWANGDVNQPTWSELIQGVNPNLYTVSIEHEGHSGEPRPAAMEAALTKVLVWIQQQTGLHYVPHKTLIGHYEIDPVQRANCPGPTVDYANIADAGNGVPPIGDIMRTALQRQNASWQSMGVTHKADAPSAFELKARELGGAAWYPLGEEYRDQQAGEPKIAGQCFGPVGVALETVEGEWALDKIQAYSIMTGLPWTKAPPANAPPVVDTAPHITSFVNAQHDHTSAAQGGLLAAAPPVGDKRLAVLPQTALDWRIILEPHAAAPGEHFYGLVGVSDPKVDVEVRFVFNVLSAGGGQAINAACYHVWPGGYECFPVQGLVEIDLGGGSWYQWSGPAPTSPQDKFYVGAKLANPNLGEPPAAPISDVIRYGLPDHRHLSATFTFELMVG